MAETDTSFGGRSSIQLRPKKDCWAGVILSGIVALFAAVGLFTPPHKAGDIQACGLVVAICVLLASLLSVWLLRAVVVADDAGLRWRGFGKWHPAEWKEVTDYYKEIPANKPRQHIFIINTCRGRLRLSTDWWPSPNDFQAVVQRNAVQAKVREWGIFGTRPEDKWPRVFDYNTFQNRWSPWLYLACLLATLMALIVLKLGSPNRDPSWVWNAIPSGVIFLLCTPYLWMFTYLIRAIRPRFSQCITASLTGLIYEDENGQWETPWEDVTKYSIDPTKHSDLVSCSVIVSRHGTLSFTRQIKDVDLLREIVSRYACNAVESHWRLTENILGGEASLWTSGCQGVGARLFHYRTRMNRAMLWLFTFFAVTPALSVLLNRWVGGARKDDLVFVAVLTALLGLPTLWAIWRYYAASIQIDGDGITQNAVFGSRFLRWSQVDRFYVSSGDSNGFGNIVGDGKRIRFWMGIGGAEALKDEIARRAVNSRNRSWDEALPTDNRRRGTAG